jgi:hypothetical protein
MKRLFISSVTSKAHNIHVVLFTVPKDWVLYVDVNIVLFFCQIFPLSTCPGKGNIHYSHTTNSLPQNTILPAAFILTYYRTILREVTANSLILYVIYFHRTLACEHSSPK